MRTISFVFIASIAALLCAAARPADACSFPAPFLHETDPSLPDSVPPSPPVVEEVRIKRGQSSGFSGGSSCDDSGVISIVFQPGSDDMAQSNEIGYRLMLIEGTLPDGFGLPNVAVRPDGTTLVFPWIDGATNDQEAFAATVGITAIDRAGNQSTQITIEIADGGSGCSAHGRGGTGSMILMLAALVLIQVRRRVRP